MLPPHINNDLYISFTLWVQTMIQFLIKWKSSAFDVPLFCHHYSILTYKTITEEAFYILRNLSTQFTNYLLRSLRAPSSPGLLWDLIHAFLTRIIYLICNLNNTHSLMIQIGVTTTNPILMQFQHLMYEVERI